MALKGPGMKNGCLVVIDTGYSRDWRPENLQFEYDFGDGDGNACNPEFNTHGSLVTAVARESAPAVDIIELKVSHDATGQIDTISIEKALQWCVKNAETYSIDAINLSLCGGNVHGDTRSILSNELTALAAKNVLVCAAAGNAREAYGGIDGISWLASDPHVIAVSASVGGAGSGFAAFSQRDPRLTDICADGSDILVADPHGSVQSVSGTSFSSPQVAATLAQAQSISERVLGRRLTLDEAVGMLQGSGDQMGGVPDAAGYRVLDSEALLAQIGSVQRPHAIGNSVFDPSLSAPSFSALPFGAGSAATASVNGELAQSSLGWASGVSFWSDGSPDWSSYSPYGSIPFNC